MIKYIFFIIFFLYLGEIYLKTIFDRDINASENIMHIWQSDNIPAVFIKRGS